MSRLSSPRTPLAVVVAFAAAVLSAGDGNAAPGAHDRDPDLVPVGPAAAPPALQSSQASPALALAALDRRIADLDAEEEVSKRELTELGGKIAAAHARSLTRGRAFYRLTRAGMLP
ncbi:MAG: hypothetical protein KIS78_35495, partial [Labilithrix sp.]|nr:hypothetical protein [Labilithrix sp.]